MTRPLRCPAIVLAGMLLAAAGTRPVAAAEQTAGDAAAALRRGLAWLVAQQRADGSFSQPEFPALTGLSLWALAGAGLPEHGEAIRRAGDFLAASAQPDGGIYHPIPGRKGGGLATYNTAICLTALHAAGRRDLAPMLLAARDFLAASQEREDPLFRGGFGYDRENERPYADLMNTHFALEAMRRTEALEEARSAGTPRADLRWDAALAFVEGLQNPDGTGPGNAGGFFYTHNDPKAGSETVALRTAAGVEERVVLRSYGSITYAGLLALVHCRLTREDPRVRSALDWTARHWSLEENPGMGDQGLFFFYNVLGRSLDASGVRTLDRPQASALDWRSALAAKLTALQQEDGRWVNGNGRFWENDSVLTTAYALIALEAAIQP